MRWINSMRMAAAAWSQTTHNRSFPQGAPGRNAAMLQCIQMRDGAIPILLIIRADPMRLILAPALSAPDKPVPEPGRDRTDARRSSTGADLRKPCPRQGTASAATSAGRNRSAQRGDQRVGALQRPGQLADHHVIETHGQRRMLGAHAQQRVAMQDLHT